MKETTLIGLCFITHNSDYKREYQGQILSKLDNGFYLVQLYDWLIGYPSTMKIFSLNKLTNADLFRNMDELKEFANDE